MATEHNTLTDPELHEPKGAAAAVNGTTYLADGAGSGAFGWVPQAITVVISDISTAATVYVVAPFAGTVDKVYSVIDGAIITSDVVLTTSIGGTGITTGTITVATSGSAAGIVDSTTPTALNSFTAGETIEVATDGASDNTVKCAVTFYVTRTA